MQDLVELTNAELDSVAGGFFNSATQTQVNVGELYQSASAGGDRSAFNLAFNIAAIVQNNVGINVAV